MKKYLLMFMFSAFSLFALAQEQAVSGTVTDVGGEPLPGVNVLIEGTTIGTVTDFDGNYKVNVPGGNSVLVFSYIGYETVKETVGSRSVINVQLNENAEQLAEVVVVGYGTQIKQDLTGNVASVSGDAIENVPVPSFEQAIQGRAAGVYIQSQNGKVGQGINIRIRGASSVTAGNEPLYVVDGIPVTSNSQSGNSAATNPMADINFNDVESIEILKDASASAIYGSRASNGVVLITTKSGKKGKTKINFSTQHGISNPTRKRDFINGAQYVELFQEAAWNNDVRRGAFADVVDPNNPANIPAGIESHPDYTYSWLEYMHGTFDYLSGHRDWREEVANNPNWEGTNWEDQAFQDASFSTYDLSASGGDDKTSFYASGSYTDQDGILIGNSFQRVAGRLNLNHKLSDKFNFKLNVGITKSTNNRVADDNQFATPLQLVAQSPLTPVRDLEGNLYDDALNAAMFYYPATVEVENSNFTTTVFRNLVNGSLIYDVTDNLKINAEYGFDLLTQLENRYQNSRTQGGRGVGGYGSSRWVRVFNNTSRVFANWNKTLDVHNIDLTGGIEYQKSTRDMTDVEGQGFPVDQLKTVYSASEITYGTGTLNEFSFLSYFARANYKFSNRYLLTVSGRMDGSSRFGENSRYGFFPAASVGWIVSEEGFFANSSTVSFLKFRASYGLTGNAEIGNYAHYGLFGASPYNNLPGLMPTQIANPDLEWEKTAQFDAGFDFGLFNDRISGEVDYYVKNTTDLLLNVPVPGTSGFQTQLQNIGALQNRGIEVVINYDLISNNKFKWSTSANFAINENKITRLNEGQEIIFGNNLNVVKVGEQIGAFYGAEFAGADPANGDAIWYLNRTPTESELTGGSVFQVAHLGDRYVTNSFNQAERVILGNPTPDKIFGWSNDISYKNFELNFLFQGVSGNQIFNGGGTYMTANARYEDNQTLDQMARWQKPGDITDVPQARLYRNNGAQNSSRYLYDGDYIRLRTVTLGYNLPNSILSNRFQNVRVYVTGQNLLTITGYEGWDPEVNTDYLASNISLGNDFYSAPQPKTIIFGVKLGL
ncbi:MAG: SusC/RagA family TonB-linked outer membrane protein [Candidatus Cyclobacteriaceae bacterium M2_1C_046]